MPNTLVDFLVSMTDAVKVKELKSGFSAVPHAPVPPSRAPRKGGPWIHQSSTNVHKLWAGVLNPEWKDSRATVADTENLQNST